MAREYFFPFGCSLCGADLLNDVEAWYGLCETCRAGIERELEENRAGERCDYCGKPLISEHGRCLSCREEEDRVVAVDRVRFLFPYTGKYRRLLAAYKFGKNPAAGNFLAEKVVEAAADFPPEAQIVPVPPRPGKIHTTGWDQIAYLTRLLERSGSGAIDRLAINRCLKRMPSKSQKELGRENRRSNLRGRIVSVRQVPHIAVVLDDVMTTGSTLDACAAALKEAGTQTVYGLCLFYD